MRGVKELRTLAAAIGRNAIDIACFFLREGKQLLLRRARASTELQELAVQQRREELDRQRASQAVDLARNIEKVKDRRMRKALVQAFLFREPAVAEGSKQKQVVALPNLSNRAIRTPAKRSQ